MENQTIIVKKIKKGGHGHHGGGWKVAFADFAVAMMAFFLLLWLMASTTKEEKAGLAEYFSPATPGFAEGSGASESIIDMGGGQRISQGDDSKEDAMKPRAPNEDEIQQALAQEKERLESLMADLKKAIETSQALKPFKDQLFLDITAEGLRIQIVDKENRPMFDSGKAELKSYTKVILHELAKIINSVPNKISLTGHTDVSRFAKRPNYSNWELSSDRANASRRALLEGGLGKAKMAKVVGLSSMVLFNKENPRDPINRRIAIVVMNAAAEKALFAGVKTLSSSDDADQLIKDSLSGRVTEEGAHSDNSDHSDDDMNMDAISMEALDMSDGEITPTEALLQTMPPSVAETAPAASENETKASETANAALQQRIVESDPIQAPTTREITMERSDQPPPRDNIPQHIILPPPIAPINPITIP
jgi:chemotaxis protein MotB